MALEDDISMYLDAARQSSNQKPKKIPKFNDYLKQNYGGVELLPQEYNKAVDDYTQTFADLAVQSKVGMRPKRGVTQYDEAANAAREEWVTTAANLFPKRKLLSHMSSKESDQWIQNFIVKSNEKYKNSYTNEDLKTIFKYQNQNDLKKLSNYSVNYKDSKGNDDINFFVSNRMLEVAEALIPNNIEKNSALWNTLYPIKLARVQNLFAEYVNANTKSETISVQAVSGVVTTADLNAPLDSGSGPQGLLFALVWTVVIGAIGLALRSWLTRSVNNRTWQIIEHAKALNEPLYGVKGWLIVFMIGLVLGAASTLGKANQSLALIDVNLTWWRYWFSSTPGAGFFTFKIVCMLLLVLTILTLAIKKHNSFRVFTTIAILLFTPFMVGLHLIEATTDPVPKLHIGDMLGSVAYWLVSCVVWIPYLNLSKRVRLTYEHCVPVLSKLDMAVADKNPVTLKQPDNTHTDAIAKLTSIPAVKQNTDDFWEIALAEFDGPKRHAGLWARLFSESQGNENLAKANYLQTRVTQMQQA